MKKILYLMHVDWDWIKQRPHFLAEGLNNNYDVTVLYQFIRNRKGLQNNPKSHIKLHPLYAIPGAGRIKLIGFFNNIFSKLTVSIYLHKIKPDILYITHPNQALWIPRSFKGKIIYDCMDCHAGFSPDKKFQNTIKTKEKILCDRSDLVLSSSEHLKQFLIAEYNCKNIVVVRNGYTGDIITETDTVKDNNKNFVFCYFGTISSWFNLDFIIKSLEDFENIEYWLMGPVEKGILIPKHERIKVLGVIEHKNLFKATKSADCFIMPFIVNQLIESVDPVKLYEYINFNKHILTVYYDEIKRFDKFVNFYSDYTQFKQQIELLINSNEKKYSNDDRILILSNNSWNCRTEQIKAEIEKL